MFEIHTHLHSHEKSTKFIDLHNKKYMKIIDKLVYLVSLLGPIMTLPQVYEIYINKNASGVSALSWLSYAFFAIFWIIYGIAHREKPIIFNNTIWLIIEIAIVVGVVIYR